MSHSGVSRSRKCQRTFPLVTPHRFESRAGLVESNFITIFTRRKRSRARSQFRKKLVRECSSFTLPHFQRGNYIIEPLCFPVRHSELIRDISNRHYASKHGLRNKRRRKLKIYLSRSIFPSRAINLQRVNLTSVTHKDVLNAEIRRIPQRSKIRESKFINIPSVMQNITR